MILEVGWIRKGTFEGSELAAHCGLKIVVLRTKNSGMCLFFYLFMCVFYIWLVGYYLSYLALWVAKNSRDVVYFCCIFITSWY